MQVRVLPGSMLQLRLPITACFVSYDARMAASLTMPPPPIGPPRPYACMLHTHRHAVGPCLVVCSPVQGTWCSGITSASHAEGPGFKSQCVHAWWCQYSWSAGNTARSRWGRPGKSLSAPPYDHLILAVQWRAEPGCLIIADGGQRHPGGAGLATGGTMQ